MKQTLVNFDSKNDVPKTISYKVTEQGYYCVGSVSYAHINDEHASVEGYVNFRNVFSGNLPAISYPLKSVYGYLALLYTAMLIYWCYLCRANQEGNRSKFVQMFNFHVGILALVLMGDMLIQWMYMSYINYHDVDIGHWRDIHGYWLETFTIRIVFSVSILSNILREIFVPCFLFRLTSCHGILPKAININNLMKGIFGTCIACFLAFHIINTRSLNGIIREGYFIWTVLPASFATYIYMPILGAVLHNFKHFGEKHQDHKRKLFGYFSILCFLITLLPYLNATFKAVWVPVSANVTSAAQSWSYLWIVNDCTDRALHVICKLPISNLGLALLIIIFLPTAHNIQGLLSDELVTDEEAQDRDVEVHTLDDDRRDGDDTAIAYSLHASNDACTDEIPPPYPGNSSDAHTNQREKPFDLDSQADTSPENVDPFDSRASNEQQPLFDD